MPPSSNPEIILAVDTSTPAASAALANNGQIVASIGFVSAGQVSRTLFNHIKGLLDLAGLAPETVDRFAAVTGPGSFTGLRVGLSAIESMARTLGRPAVGITAFDAVAASRRTAGKVAVLLEAGRGELFYGVRAIDSRGKIESCGNDGSGSPANTVELLVNHFGDEQMIITGSGALRYAEEILDGTRASGVNCRRQDVSDPSSTAWLLLDSGPFLAEAVARLSATTEVGPGYGQLRAYYIKPPDAQAKLQRNEQSSIGTPIITAMASPEIGAVIALETRCGLSSRGSAAYERALNDRRSVMLVARRKTLEATEDCVVGAISCFLIEDELQIDNVVVEPGYRKQGIGTELLRAGLSVAEEKGALIASLEVREGNIEARGLYQKLGFKVVGRRKDYYADPRDDALTMTLDMRGTTTETQRTQRERRRK